MLYFQPGIPIFSGMAIYRLHGGGASYHMLQTNEVAPSVLANGFSNTPRIKKGMAQSPLMQRPNRQRHPQSTGKRT